MGKDREEKRNRTWPCVSVAVLSTRLCSYVFVQTPRTSLAEKEL